jgi:hypothetical protein
MKFRLSNLINSRLRGILKVNGAHSEAEGYITVEGVCLPISSSVTLNRLVNNIFVCTGKEVFKFKGIFRVVGLSLVRHKCQVTVPNGPGLDVNFSSDGDTFLDEGGLLLSQELSCFIKVIMDDCKREAVKKHQKPSES